MSGPSGSTGPGAVPSPSPNGTGIFEGATIVAAGGHFTCAAYRLSGQESGVSCWGQNTYQQAGTAASEPVVRAPNPIYYWSSQGQIFPTKFYEPSSLAAGYGHACGVQNGRVVCWGYNSDGQLGNGLTTLSDRYGRFVKINSTTDLTEATSVALGAYHSCAIVGAARRLYCWGKNTSYQIGNGSDPKVYYARAVTTGPTNAVIDNVAQVFAGTTHTCVVYAVTGGVSCFGSNVFGERGNNSTSTTASSTPAAVVIADSHNSFPPFTAVTEARSRNYHSCGVNSGGALFCWGYNAFSNLGSLIPATTARVASAQRVYDGPGPLADVRSLGAGAYHSCAIVGVNRTVKCWGRNDYLALGVSEVVVPTHSNVPRVVEGLNGAPALENVSQISLGEDHSCALLSNGRVVCWGRSNSAQTGYQEDDFETVNEHSTPVPIYRINRHPPPPEESPA